MQYSHDHDVAVCKFDHVALGGSARTDMTLEGFLFDQGGHVVFSHSTYFDELITAGLQALDPLCPLCKFLCSLRRGVVQPDSEVHVCVHEGPLGALSLPEQHQRA